MSTAAIVRPRADLAVRDGDAHEAGDVHEAGDEAGTGMKLYFCLCVPLGSLFYSNGRAEELRRFAGVALSWLRRPRLKRSTRERVHKNLIAASTGQQLKEVGEDGTWFVQVLALLPVELARREWPVLAKRVASDFSPKRIDAQEYLLDVCRKRVTPVVEKIGERVVVGSAVRHREL